MIKEGINCLNNFSNFEEIKKEFPKIKNWIIPNIKYEERLEKLENSNLFKELYEKINKSKHYKKSEILSWIDSLNLVYRIFNNEILHDELKRDARLIQEYSIPYTRNNRCDFLIVKDNKICILEFTFKNSIYIEKAQQCFTYKQILQQFLPTNIEIISYVFSYSPEENDDSKKLDEQILQCCNFLNFFFNSGKAYDELNKVKDINE